VRCKHGRDKSEDGEEVTVRIEEDKHRVVVEKVE
jgi:hypothetical protein